MRMLKILVSIILSLGLISCSSLAELSVCGVGYEPIPGYGAAGQKMIGDYYDAGRTSVAMDIFYENWTDDLGGYEEVEFALSGVCVDWEPYPWILESLGTYEDGVPKRAAGLAVSRRVIKVFIGENEDGEGNEIERTISATAFWHELVHISLWSLNNESDPDHEGSTYSGWGEEQTEVISDSRKEGASLGI